MKAEVNIKLNDDYSITLDNVRYIPDFWSEAKVSAKPEKRHTGIEEPAEDQTMCCGHGGRVFEEDYAPALHIRGSSWESYRSCRKRRRAMVIQRLPAVFERV